MRRPIQCQGIERGPQRAAKIGVVGSVQPQISFGDILGTVGSTVLPILGSLFG